MLCRTFKFSYVYWYILSHSKLKFCPFIFKDMVQGLVRQTWVMLEKAIFRPTGGFVIKMRHPSMGLHRTSYIGAFQPRSGNILMKNYLFACKLFTVKCLVTNSKICKGFTGCIQKATHFKLQ